MFAFICAVAYIWKPRPYCVEIYHKCSETYSLGLYDGDKIREIVNILNSKKNWLYNMVAYDRIEIAFILLGDKTMCMPNSNMSPDEWVFCASKQIKLKYPRVVLSYYVSEPLNIDNKDPILPKWLSDEVKLLTFDESYNKQKTSQVYSMKKLAKNSNKDILLTKYYYFASNRPSQEQKNLIGEQLYPRIHRIRADVAGKVTGMLLEAMDRSELLNLLEGPSALEKKVSEAINVLDKHKQQNRN